MAEAAWLIESRLGPAAESVFVAAVATGTIEVVDLTRSHCQRCVELIGTYADLGLGVVDASLVAVAEHSNLIEIATLNHRDFTVVRPAHTDAFQLLPGPN